MADFALWQIYKVVTAKSTLNKDVQNISSCTIGGVKV